ncbi:anti-sigma-factor antagonist [Mycolicibacterium mageritense DSM 44476 = CIP 104973]|uniref:Sulfate transporter n=1 Tax=Mycolicibacterium mageritense TaxID=53462 RepID=A0ABN5YBD0_MYCME|nr:STAS domain-containing protein [Mycolicibacterium mageritense]MCC9182832.1 STAS domain-containing protein [Mycolicibacterium mageritense]BBX35435.1 sulfate transporter [Mycolicibacterium mageritense]CDO20057.1 anti-sigma-factor antagonist [Mycolicibacterium mageritense DSM 44476 = CIP 104973]
MSVTTPTAHSARTDGIAAVFATRWMSESAAVVAAHGDIDAANSTEFADYAARHAAHADRMVVDLSAVDFFGAAGFSALTTVAAQCAADSCDWRLVPSRAVARLLRVCDTDHRLPTSDTVSAALSTMSSASPLLQLVAKSR